MPSICQLISAMVASLLFAVQIAASQTSGCETNGSIAGVVRDPTGAVIVRGSVLLYQTLILQDSTTTGLRGEFVFSCVPAGKYILRVGADGFESRDLPLTLGSEKPGQLSVSLRVAMQHIKVSAVDDSSPPDPGPGSALLNEAQLTMLADDPDDLQRQLQSLAAAMGGIPGKATIAVDEFSGVSRLPPKSAIREIRINPDLFSAEYEAPPYQGGRIEVTTKAGQTKFHGSVFFSDGGLPLNARDPLASAATPADKQRYGGDWSGPLLRSRNDFSLHLERRDIQESRIVNAFILAPSGQELPFTQNVPTRRSLWLGSIRTAWKLDANNTLTALLTAHVNDSTNDGVGGTVLPEAGYSTSMKQYDARISNVDAISVKLLHETRFAFSWKTVGQTPNSSAPALDVAGAFTGGGAASQFQKRRERDLEFYDTLLLNLESHTFKWGVLLSGKILHDFSNTMFNGVFRFGGDFASGRLFIPGLEQYRLGLLGLPGGRPTTFTLNRGDPLVELTQWRWAAFLQDQWKLKHRIGLSLGLRYAAQTEPSVTGTWAPRLGVAWSPWSKHQWIVRARVGLFYQPIEENAALQALRLNGRTETQILLYSPVFASSPDPSTALAVVQSRRRLAGEMQPARVFETQVGVEDNLPRHWKLEVSAYWTWARHLLRSVNVNSPLPDGALNPVLAPRPGLAGVNIFEYQSSGSLRGPVVFVGINQFSSKRYSLLVGYLHFGMTTQADGPDMFPQSSFSTQGETARPSWQATHRVFSIAQIQLPRSVALGANLEAASGLPYNITTGFDNNGDGIFNDRPAVTDLSGPQAFPTRFGLLTPATLTGNLPRNVGTMPVSLHLDLSVNRRFTMHPSDPESSQSVTITGRMSNVLNHTNVTAVNGILGSPILGRALAADFGRRVELGIRYGF